jgi:hypothetical protein
MTEKKIKLYNFDYHLKLNDENVVTSASFSIAGKLPAALSEDEVKLGQIMSKEIFDGKWDWLINAKDYIYISEFNMNIRLSDVEYDGAIRWGYGEISGGQKEVCTHCEDPNCEWDCMEALEWASDRDPDMCTIRNEELESNRNYNKACDAIESLVLAHACAGIDVNSKIYLEGLRSAMDAISNNM